MRTAAGAGQGRRTERGHRGVLGPRPCHGRVTCARPLTVPPCHRNGTLLAVSTYYIGEEGCCRTASGPGRCCRLRCPAPSAFAASACGPAGRPCPFFHFNADHIYNGEVIGKIRDGKGEGGCPGGRAHASPRVLQLPRAQPPDSPNMPCSSLPLTEGSREVYFFDVAPDGNSFDFSKRRPRADFKTDEFIHVMFYVYMFWGRCNVPAVFLALEPSSSSLPCGCRTGGPLPRPRPLRLLPPPWHGVQERHRDPAAHFRLELCHPRPRVRPGSRSPAASCCAPAALLPHAPAQSPPLPHPSYISPRVACARVPRSRDAVEYGYRPSLDVTPTSPISTTYTSDFVANVGGARRAAHTQYMASTSEPLPVHCSARCAAGPPTAAALPLPQFAGVLSLPGTTRAQFQLRSSGPTRVIINGRPVQGLSITGGCDTAGVPPGAPWLRSTSCSMSIPGPALPCRRRIHPVPPDPPGRRLVQGRRIHRGR